MSEIIDEMFGEDHAHDGLICKVDTEKRQAFGWAYVTHDKDGSVVIDKSGEYVDDVEELEKAAYHFVQNSRVGGHWHRRTDEDLPVHVSDLIESFVTSPDKIEKMGIPPGIVPTGWWVGFKINDDEVWEKVRNGELRSFSVHGRGKKVKVD